MERPKRARKLSLVFEENGVSSRKAVATLVKLILNRALDAPGQIALLEITAKGHGLNVERPNRMSDM